MHAETSERRCESSIERRVFLQMGPDLYLASKRDRWHSLVDDVALEQQAMQIREAGHRTGESATTEI